MHDPLINWRLLNATEAATEAALARDTQDGAAAAAATGAAGGGAAGGVGAAAAGAGGGAAAAGGAGGGGGIMASQQVCLVLFKALLFVSTIRLALLCRWLLLV